MKNRAERRKRLQKRRAVATEWVRNEYPAMKVAARLAGVYEFIPWYEFECLSHLEMFNKKKRLSEWIDAGPVWRTALPAMPFNRTPYQWLHTSPSKYLTNWSTK